MFGGRARQSGVVCTETLSLRFALGLRPANAARVLHRRLGELAAGGAGLLRHRVALQRDDELYCAAVISVGKPDLASRSATACTAVGTTAGR